jgi:hypothetical protein
MIRLLDLILEAIPREVYSHQIPNPNYYEGPGAKKTVSVAYALRHPRASKLHQVAKAYVERYRVADSDPKGTGQASRYGERPVPTDTSKKSRKGGPNQDGPRDQPPQDRLPQDDLLSKKAHHKATSISQEHAEEVVGFIKKRSDEGKLKIDGHDSIEDWLQSENRNVVEKFLESYSEDITLNHLLSAAYSSYQGFAEATGIDTPELSIECRMLPGEPILDIEISLRSSESNKLARGNYRFNNESPEDSYFYGNLLVLDGDGVSPGSAGDIIKPTLTSLDTMGITRINFQAGLQAGGIRWAQVGGIPETPRMLGRHIHSNFQEIKNLAEPDSDHILFIDPLAKHNKQLLSAIQKLKNKGELEFTFELIKSMIEELASGDGQFLSVIANTSLGRYILKDTFWEGYFDISPGSESRELLEKQLR